MSDLTLAVIRLTYLAILWLFVLSAISVMRSDLFGARNPSKARRAGRNQKKRAPRPSKPRRGAPSKVVIVDGGNKGTEVALAGAPLLIGRGTDAAIRLDDDYVSTRHARIGVSHDQLYVEDLGSTNGTYVGSSRITQPTAIQLGTQIRIGKTILELRK